MKNYCITFHNERGRCVATATFRADDVKAADRIRAFDGMPLRRRIVADGDPILSLPEIAGGRGDDNSSDRNPCIPSTGS